MKNTAAVFLLLICSLFSFCSPEAEPDSYETKRQRMVKFDIKARGIKDEKVLDAMLKIPRHLFVDEPYRKYAYGDHPLPINAEQTISQPYIVALMSEALKLKVADRILEIGTGSGYQAAVLGEIVKEVYSLEIKKILAEKSGKLLKKLGYKNVKIKFGDGYFGWKEHAPFDAIIITAAANKVPKPLIDQLKEGGRMILPLGKTKYHQTLTIFRKKNNKMVKEEIIPVRFVPMTGQVKK
jgi:protein-L-isoaspartate(D-aspartate) O-methyltransferase